ncbi:MAG TPA: hypothetical protein VGE09_11180 [Pseudoxanthomonas sp.]
MTDRLEFIQELLQETRDEQRKGNTILAELRIQVAVLQRTQNGIEQTIAAVRAEMDRRHADHDRRHADLESRVRVLEGDGRETKVVAKAVTGGVRDIWRYTAAAAVGAIMAAIAWAAKVGGPPG